MQGFIVPDSDRIETPPARPGPARVRQVIPPRKPKPDVRQVGNQLGIVDPDTGSFTPTYTAPDKPKEGQTPLSEKAKASARRAAISKINLIRSIRRRMNADSGGVLQGDLIPETGLGGFLMSKIGGTLASDIAADIETLKRGGALSEVTRLMEEYGKNPFTPMANYESELLAGAPANLTLNQSAENLRKNLDEYERFYMDTFSTLGGKLKGQAPAKPGAKKPAAPPPRQPAAPKVIDFNDLPE